MPAQIPSEDEVLGYFDKLSNWGRWGPDDELGTPNLITPEVTKRALATVREGVTVSLAREIMWEGALDVPSPPVHYMLESGEGWASGEKVSARPNQAAIDYIGMVFHGVAVTHVDSLAHFFWNGKTYNGKPAHLVSTSLGATVCSVVAAKQGFVSRGVLVDVPLVRGIDWVERGEGVSPGTSWRPRSASVSRCRKATSSSFAPDSCTAATSRALSTGRPAPLPVRPPACPCFTNAASPSWAQTPATTSPRPSTRRSPNPSTR